MKHAKVAFLLISALSAAPLVANADAITYDFTGTVYNASGSYASIAIGTSVSGTYTFNYAAAIPGQTYGSVGSSSNWTVAAIGGSASGSAGAGEVSVSLPSAVPSGLVFSSTLSVGAISYSSAQPGSYISKSSIQGFNSNTNPNLDFISLAAGEENDSGSNVSTGSDLFLNAGAAGQLPFTADGLPDPANINMANSTGYIVSASANSSSELFFNLTSISPASPVPLPNAAWLMLSGLFGIGAFARKKQNV